MADEPLPTPRGTATLSDRERAEAMRSESLWRRAHEIVTRHSHLDAGDVYHALRALEPDPAARLRRGLSRGRLRAYARPPRGGRTSTHERRAGWSRGSI